MNFNKISWMYSTVFKYSR